LSKTLHVENHNSKYYANICRFADQVMKTNQTDFVADKIGRS